MAGTQNEKSHIKAMEHTSAEEVCLTCCSNTYTSAVQLPHSEGSAMAASLVDTSQ